MKAKAIAAQYKLNKQDFERFIRNSRYNFRDAITGMDIDDNQNIIDIVNAYLSQKARENEAEEYERKKAERAAEEKRIALSTMLITSGFSFDGHTIVKYSGYISGDDAIQVPRGTSGFLFDTTTNVADSLMASLVKIRRNALAELKEAAYNLGCNAVIGVDFDYITLDPETANSSGGTTYLPYVFGVTANGNAVVIKSNKEPQDGDSSLANS